MQRDEVRLGAVSFSVSPKWLKLLTGLKQRDKTGVEYFDAETLGMRKTEILIEGDKTGIVKDTS